MTRNRSDVFNDILKNGFDNQQWSLKEKEKFAVMERVEMDTKQAK
jgi:hypothetical protein